MLLADATPAPAMLGNAILTALVILGGASTCISLAGLFATRRELDSLQKNFEAHAASTRDTHDQLFNKLGGMERGLRGEFRGELDALRTEIGQAAREVSRLSATVIALNQSLATATARLDRLADRQKP
jgi:septal ring factor EnvC (AmiA/AmiB activator)